MTSEPHSEDDRTQSFTVLTAGTSVSHYKVIKKIGAGGMGEVYLAQDTTLEREVALKFLPSHLCQDEDCRARFKREALAAAKLDHPNIIQVYEVAEYQNRPFFAMQHVEGRSLREFADGRDLKVEQILELGIQICEGLHAAHEKGVTHRDIKPSNILIDSYGRARIVDFGLAVVQGTDQLTKTGSTLGTVGYMSPEQVRGNEVDHRSDLFSLGVVLYELIAKRNPFKRDSEAATLKAVSDDTPDPLARFKANIPEGLQNIIDKTLEKDVKTRYQHADGVLSDLMRVKRSLDASTSRVSTNALAEKSNRVWWIVLPTIAVAAMVVLALTQPWKRTSTADRSHKIMLAVLPFENLGAAEDEYFADGMTEEITTSLARLSGLGVISRTSAIQYKNTEKNLRQIGKELGVEYVLEGTIRWDKADSGNRVRINPQLIRVSDDLHIWANRYDAVLTDVFQIQSSIAQDVANALNVTLLQAERDALTTRQDVDPAAYDYYLKGKQYFTVTAYQQKEFRLAERMFLKAVELAPDFAAAYAELGALYTEMYWDRVDPNSERLETAKRMVDKALILAPNAPESHQALGWYYYHGLRDYDGAIDAFEKVLELQPNNVLAVASTAWVKRRQGKWDKALAGLLSATRLAPRESWYQYELGITYLGLRRYQEAFTQFDRVIDLQPDHQWAYVLKSWTLVHQTGRTNEARTVLENSFDLVDRWPTLTWFEVHYDLWDGKYDHALSLLRTPADVNYPGNVGGFDYYYLKGEIFARMDQNNMADVYLDSARVLLETKRDSAPDEAALLGSLAKVYAALGRKDEAVQAARRAVEIVPTSTDALRGPDFLVDLATVYTRVGEEDSAIAVFDHLLSIPSNMSVNLLRLVWLTDPLLDSAGFQQLLERHENTDET